MLLIESCVCWMEGAGTFAEFRQIASGLQNSAKVSAPDGRHGCVVTTIILSVMAAQCAL